MTAKRPSLRKCIDEACKACIFDKGAPGTWRQQVTVCTSFDCPLYPVRPKTPDPIPKSVLDGYGLDFADFPPDSGFTVKGDV